MPYATPEANGIKPYCDVLASASTSRLSPPANPGNPGAVLGATSA
jgi:hypothetical protein